MCFTNESNQVTAKVAKNDIECYKYLIENDGELSSPCYGNFEWPEKETLEEKNFKEEGDFEISRGFHSCKTVKDCQNYRDEMYDEGNYIYKFIIPKGALYFENETQYVSNKIYLASKESVEELVEA